MAESERTQASWIGLGHLLRRFYGFFYILNDNEDGLVTGHLAYVPLTLARIIRKGTDNYGLVWKKNCRYYIAASEGRIYVVSTEHKSVRS